MARVRLRVLYQSDIEQTLGKDFNTQQKQDYINNWVLKQLWEIEAKKGRSLKREHKDQVRGYRSSLLIKQYRDESILNKIMISENEVITHYNDHAEDFTTHDRAAYVEIFICADMESAQEVVSDIKNKNTPGPSAQLRLVYNGDCIESINEQIFGKNSPDLIGPVKHNSNYYVVSVIERYSKNSQLRVEHVREDIIQKLRMYKYLAAIQLKEKELKEKINVKIY